LLDKRESIARRLGVDPNLIFAFVREGEILVEFDEDITDGIVLDVFLREN